MPQPHVHCRSLPVSCWRFGSPEFSIARRVRRGSGIRSAGFDARAEICAADRLLLALHEEGQRLGARRLPRLRFSSNVESPLLIGLWRPTIVLPADVEQKFDEAELRLMIAHELAHLARHDLAWNWLPTVAAWLFFFHPLVWLMVRRWCEAQEAACDEAVIQHGVAQPADYGRLLLKLSASSPFESSAALGAAGVLGAYRNLERRILAMARVKPFSARRLAVALGAVLLTAVATIVPWRLVAAEPKPEKQKAVVTGTWAPNRFVRGRPQQPKEETDPVTLAALKRLREMGATPAGVQPFSGLLIGIQNGWKGTEADLDLIAQVADLKWLYFGLDDVSAEAVATLVPKLKQPLDVLGLQGLSDERLTALGQLPKCKLLMLGQPTLSAAGFRHLAEMAEGIESLQPYGQIDDAALAAIGQIKSLKELWLTQAQITDAGLPHLAGLERLEKLMLLDCRGVHGAGYASLSRVKSFRVLTIANPTIGGEEIEALGKLTQLETLVLQPDRLPPAGLKAGDVQALKNLQNLRTLFINAGPGNDAAKRVSGEALLAVAGQLPSLRQLVLSGISADADALAALAQASTLEELTLFDVTASDRGLAALGQLKNLKQMRLTIKGTVTSQTWARLIGLKQLALLALNGSSLDDAGLATLANLSALEEFDLTSSKITGTGLKALASLKQLKTLALPGAPSQTKGPRRCAGFSALESLSLAGTKITDRALDAIASLPRLMVLSLDKTAITVDGLLKLRDSKELSEVSIGGVKLSDDDKARLRAAMPEVHFSDGEFNNYQSAAEPEQENLSVAMEPNPEEEKENPPTADVITGVLTEKTIQALWGLSPGLHGIAMASALYGTVVGSLLGGWPADRFGRKATLLWIGVLYFAGAVGSGLAPMSRSLLLRASSAAWESAFPPSSLPCISRRSHPRTSRPTCRNVPVQHCFWHLDRLRFECLAGRHRPKRVALDARSSRVSLLSLRCILF